MNNVDSFTVAINSLAQNPIEVVISLGLIIALAWYFIFQYPKNQKAKQVKEELDRKYATEMAEKELHLREEIARHIATSNTLADNSNRVIDNNSKTIENNTKAYEIYSKCLEDLTNQVCQLRDQTVKCTDNLTGEFKAHDEHALTVLNKVTEVLSIVQNRK